MISHRLCLLAALAVLAWPVRAGAVTATKAEPLPKTGTFIFSSACESDGGDFAGYRVHLTLNASGAQAMVEFNDDGLDGREIARDLTFDPATGALRFLFRSGDGDHYSFEGTASREKLVGAFDMKPEGEKSVESGDLLTLPAIKAVQKRLSPCDTR